MTLAERGRGILEIFADAARLGEPRRRAYVDPSGFVFFRRKGPAGCFHCGRPVWRRFARVCAEHRR